MWGYKIFLTTLGKQPEKQAYMRGDDPDGDTEQLCLLPSGMPGAALWAAVSTECLSADTELVEDASAPAAATVMSPTVAAAEAVDSVFFADKSITSGSHSFFTWCITPAYTRQQCYHINCEIMRSHRLPDW